MTNIPDAIMRTYPRRNLLGRKRWWFDCSTCETTVGPFDDQAAAITGVGRHVEQQHDTAPVEQLREQLAEARTALRIAEGDRDAAEGHARRLLDQPQEMADERHAWQERGDRAEAAIARVRVVLDDPSALDWRLRIRDALDQPHPDQPAARDR